jgi:hypothetical protein
VWATAWSPVWLREVKVRRMSEERTSPEYTGSVLDNYALP